MGGAMTEFGVQPYDRLAVIAQSKDQETTLIICKEYEQWAEVVRDFVDIAFTVKPDQREILFFANRQAKELEACRIKIIHANYPVSKLKGLRICAAFVYGGGVLMSYKLYEFIMTELGKSLAMEHMQAHESL